MAILRSDCCEAKLIISGEPNYIDGVDYGTHFYSCSECGKACSVISIKIPDKK